MLTGRRGEAAYARLRITCVVGTRPEVIKMAPVIMQLRHRPWAEVSVLSTSQHRHLVDPLLAFFGLAADDDLDAMTANQPLPELTARVLTRASDALTSMRPDWVIAQGDTTSVMATALACFYAAIPFAHVEAGLRTGDLQRPFPEELNRAVTARMARINFAPTAAARDNLLREGVADDSIFVTGNTVIDALLWTAARAAPLPLSLEADRRVLLLTLHRRESFGAPMRSVFAAIRRLVERNPGLTVVYPVHPNPNIRESARESLGHVTGVHLLPPLPYPEFGGLLKRADIVLTDSGGVQEEAPALGKPVLVARDITERPEAIQEGVARIVGTDRDRIVFEVERLLNSPDAYADMARGASPYGDGQAGRRIADILHRFANPDIAAAVPIAHALEVSA